MDKAEQFVAGELIKTFEESHIRNFAVRWMRKNYPDLGKTNPDDYCSKLGLVTLALTDLWEEK